MARIVVCGGIVPPLTIAEETAVKVPQPADMRSYRDYPIHSDGVSGVAPDCGEPYKDYQRVAQIGYKELIEAAHWQPGMYCPKCVDNARRQLAAMRERAIENGWL